MREFVYKDDKSHKFWNIELEGTSYTVTFGKVGTDGQTRPKEFADEEKARKAYEKVVAEKVGKGYVETTATESAPRTALLDNLEQALVNNPDDLASHSALADYLIEQNDPRGELIQIQLALEDPATKGEERKALQKRERELLDHHARHWLGDLGRFLVGKWSGEDKPWNYRFRRGWLDSLRLLPFIDRVIVSLSHAQEARLLRELEIVYDMNYHYEEFGPYLSGPLGALHEGESEEDPENWEDWAWDEKDFMDILVASPNLTKLRVLRLGYSDRDVPLCHSTQILVFDHCTVQHVLSLLKSNPGLEELYLNADVGDVHTLFSSELLSNLHVLQYYFGMGYSRQDSASPYPLEHLAKNESLTNLTALKLHPGRDARITLDEMKAILNAKNLPNLTHLQIHMTQVDDEGAQAIVDSKIMSRLKILDIGYGNMTDEGAKLLAECDDIRNLEVLNVERNALSQSGIQTLEKAGPQIIAGDQHPADDDTYLWEVDYE